ncbi:unnamed protein product [Cylindrotheca closterium]|uniref:Uncharacterized protein n=1 Tax=Cylindrotheca closterium TaxID=2856 RepID=A0AAD2CND4_9STRA|nr:unnamed protein product [Cylindrotheca closterium]
MSIQIVINQNQQTISFLEAKDYDSAIVSSSFALEWLGSIPPIMSQQDEEILHSGSSSSSSPESSFDQCMLLTSIPEGDDQFGTLTFMYTRAILLPSNVTDHGIITPILIFNAALAHHLAAMRKDERSPQYLDRAMQLYTLVYHSQDVMENPLFHFVVYNNAALIDLQIGGNQDTWKAYFRHLVHIYMILVDESCISELRHIQGFLGSLLTTKPAAAAA